MCDDKSVVTVHIYGDRLSFPHLRACVKASCSAVWAEVPGLKAWAQICSAQVTTATLCVPSSIFKGADPIRVGLCIRIF